MMTRLGPLCLALLCAAAVAGESTPLSASAGGPIPVVLAPKERAVLSAQVQATVREVVKELGQPFAAEEALLLLDDRIYRASRDKAFARWQNTQEELKAKESLFTDSALSVVDLEKARLEARAAQADLAIAEKELADCVVRAPYPGRVVAVYASRSESVRPGDKLVEVVDDRLLRAQMLVPAQALEKIALGRTVKIRIALPPSEVEAKISHIGPVLDSASATVKVYAEIDNKDGKFLGGQRGVCILDSP